jgi:hypothetical protein
VAIPSASEPNRSSLFLPSNSCVMIKQYQMLHQHVLTREILSNDAKNMERVGFGKNIFYIICL